MIHRIFFAGFFGLSTPLLCGCIRYERGIRMVDLYGGDVQVITLNDAPVWTSSSIRGFEHFELRQSDVGVRSPQPASLFDRHGLQVAELLLHTGEHFVIVDARSTERWELLDVNEHEAVFDVRGYWRGYWWMGIPDESFRWTVLARAGDGETTPFSAPPPPLDR